MKLRRREFLGTALAAGAAAMAPGIARAQDAPAPARAPEIKTRKVTIERVFAVPDIHPNALEATPEGIWSGDQVSERAFLMDWKTGKPLKTLQTECHNTSGIAVGGGSLWLDANGGVSGRRPPRPTDGSFGEIIQADLNTGKTIKAYKPVWNGGCHGCTFNPKTQTLWVVNPGGQQVAEMDIKDNLRILRLVPVHGDRPHGIDFDPVDGHLWVLYAGADAGAGVGKKVEKLDNITGRVMNRIEIAADDPDQHGMCLHDGYMYYCDAGLHGDPGPGSAPGWIVRFKL